MAPLYVGIGANACSCHLQQRPQRISASASARIGGIFRSKSARSQLFGVELVSVPVRIVLCSHANSRADQ
ncbi:hypothetical protein DDD63_09660 [Actinobaculum sp. 313]|nr:hypothetical protein DDD63_09660 [Actinobaculum sp. 313]